MKLTARVLVALLFSLPALAQDADGGLVDDGGAGACPEAPRCLDDVTLEYCDDGELVVLECSVVHEDAVCGLLSDEWGFDCLLPEGAECDPAYADGRSRCGTADEGLCCVDGECAEADESPACEAFLPDDPPRPPMSDRVDDDTTTASCLGLPGCEGLPTVTLLPLGLWLARRRRRR